MMENNADKIFKAVGAEVVLTSAHDLRQYLTGFASTFGYVISDKNGSSFYTDTRYLEAAEKQLSGSGIKVKVFERGQTPYDLLKGYKQVAIPVEKTYAPTYNKLKELGYEVVDSMPAFTKAMAVKSDDELESIKLACKAADAAITKLYGEVKEGITENDLAALLEYLMRKEGASGTSFETICAFGANSSVPHHETDNTKLKFGDIVLIDFGCKVNGYCSDCTRTFLFGDDGKHEDFKRAYGHVLKAHMLAKEKITCGMTGRVADAVARDYLAEFGYDKYFTHSLGHGIGINIHEFPRLSPASEDVLLNGMVFSDEPGVYFAGDFGIRIEDSVTLQDGKIISLTDTDKNLIIL